MWSHHPAAYTPASQSPRGGGGRGHAPEAIAAQAAASASSGPGGSGAPSAMLEDIHRQRTASTKNQYPVNLTKIITGDRGRDAVFIKFAAAWYDHRELVRTPIQPLLPSPTVVSLLGHNLCLAVLLPSATRRDASVSGCQFEATTLLRMWTFLLSQY